MSKIKLDFNISGLWNYLRDRYTDKFLDIRYLVLFESDFSESNYYPIDIIKYSDMLSIISTENASENFLEKFYRIRFYKEFIYKQEIIELRNQLNENAFQVVIQNSNEIDLYDFDKNFLFELNKLLPDVVTRIVDDVREWVGDLNFDDPAFTDEQYIQMIKFALKQIKGETNLLRVNEDDIYLIQLLVRESIALNLAHDYAKYYKLTSPGAELDKSEISRHYIDVANAIREQYEAYSRRLNLSSGGYNDQGIITQMPTYEVNRIRRKSHIYGVYLDESSFVGKDIKLFRRKFFDHNERYFKR
ncbi:MAG: hypothetical protein KatS3mg068_1580 [Candidatus Sericytochromatia bacterium]|nr:MAG: hypothetical protein KatS3mg068_1580 [Candidatus Sericytochromatia bacterium]